MTTNINNIRSCVQFGSQHYDISVQVLKQNCYQVLTYLLQGRMKAITEIDYSDTFENVHFHSILIWSSTLTIFIAFVWVHIDKIVLVDI